MGPLTFFHQHRLATINLGTITVIVKPFLRSCLDSRLVSLAHVVFSYDATYFQHLYNVA